MRKFTLTSVVFVVLLLAMFITGCLLVPTDTVNSTAENSQSSSKADPSENTGDSSASSAEGPSDISSEEISGDTSSEVVSEPEAEPPEPTFIPDTLLYVISNFANFRAGPSTDHEIIRQIGHGSQIRCYGRIGEWFLAVFNEEIKGFVHESLLSEKKSDPIIEPPVIIPSEFTKWPAEYSVSGSYDPKLEEYINRFKGEGYLPLEGICVVIDPGHGGRDPGAVYYNSATGKTIYEKTFNLEIALDLEDELKSMGATVIMTRNTDEYLGLYKRNAIVNMTIAERLLAQDTLPDTDRSFLEKIVTGLQAVFEKNSDNESYECRGIMHGIGVSKDLRRFFDMSAEMKDMLFISIHCNSFPQDPSVNGIEIYFGHPSAIRRTEEQWLRDDPRTIVVNPSYDMYDIASRRRLALLMRDNLLDGTDLGVRKNSEDRTGQSDGIFHGDYCVIRENNITGVLFEVGFLTNADDRGFFSEPAGQKRIAHSIAESVYDYFCVPPDGSQS